MTNDEKLKEIELLKARATSENMSPEDLQHQREQALLSQDLAELKTAQQQMKGLKLAVLAEVKKEAKSLIDDARLQVRDLEKRAAAVSVTEDQLVLKTVQRALAQLQNRSELAWKARQRDRIYLIAYSCMGVLAVGTILIWVFKHAA